MHSVDAESGPRNTRPPRSLVIAYGNPLRGDDGLAWRAADDLELKLAPPDVEILRLQQLIPELADTLRSFDIVIFVDAASADDGHRAGDVRVKEIAETDPGVQGQNRLSHHLTPEAVVRLAAQLYQSNLRAFSVTLIGRNFGHGEALSAVVEEALPELISRVEEIVRQVNTVSATKRR